MIRNAVKNIPHNVNKKFEASIHNRFDIEVRDAKTGELKQKAQAFNVICANLWAQFRNTWFKYIAYGDGVGTPSSEDTSLFGTASYATLSDVETVTDLENGVCWRTRKTTIDEMTAVNVTISEVGLSYSNGSGYLCTHAMLQDMNGNPISIHKTNTDIVTFYATVFVHWNPLGYNGVTISKRISYSSGIGTFLGVALGYGFELGIYQTGFGNSYASLVRAGLGTFITTDVTESAYNHPPAISWDPTTKTLEIGLRRISAGKGNIDGGFGLLKIINLHNSSSPVQFAIIDVRGEYEITAEAIGTGDGSKTQFQTAFDLPTNATIFVDGVAVSNARVLTIPRLANAANYFVQIEDILYNGKMIYRCDEDLAFGCYYNPLYEIGLKSFSSTYSYTKSHLRFSFSDDLVTWSDPIACGTIPEQYRHCKYIKMSSVSTSLYRAESLTVDFMDNMYGDNIIFDEPPAQGSVITANYTTPFVPKDLNHVYDISFTVQYGEYSQEGV